MLKKNPYNYNIRLTAGIFSNISKGRRPCEKEMEDIGDL